MSSASVFNGARQCAIPSQETAYQQPTSRVDPTYTPGRAGVRSLRRVSKRRSNMAEHFRRLQTYSTSNDRGDLSQSEERLGQFSRE
ncbi:hypothetical protein TRAPUB_7816 [Trametes pubescens]|uniref:Uncharacterized protein n=1 Tax=Trametes pubescens TaxID=154538 RepID=A0A1M2V2F0_TRAPU|nr:hypothetical protein TRAPUB_7816 [Trametes pubescens]